MNSFRVQNLLILVSISGLLACTPDKPTKREDQWRFTPPEIVLPGKEDGLDRDRLRIAEASQKEVPINSELSFSGSNENVALEIDSNCNYGDQHFEESFQMQTPESLEVGSIIPARALLKLTDQTLECSFDFSAVNEHRSRHRFLIPSVKISPISTYGNLIVSQKLQRISPASEGEAQTVIMVDDLDQLAIDSEIRTGIAELVCADFTSREKFISVDTIDWKQLAYKQPIDVLEKVLGKFRQPCRLALKDGDGVRKAISSTFTIRYPPPPIQLASSTGTLGRGDDGSRRNATLLNLKITNTSNVDQVFALPNVTVPIRMVFSVLRSGDNNMTGHHHEMLFTPYRHPTGDISHAVTGAEKVISAHNKVFFTVKAKASVDVAVIATAYFNYGTVMKIRHAGYVFVFDQPLRLERIQAEGELEAAIQAGKFEKAGDEAIFKTLPHHFLETHVYLPHERSQTPWEFVTRTMREGAFPPVGPT